MWRAWIFHCGEKYLTHEARGTFGHCSSMQLMDLLRLRDTRPPSEYFWTPPPLRHHWQYIGHKMCYSHKPGNLPILLLVFGEPGQQQMQRMAIFPSSSFFAGVVPFGGPLDPWIATECLLMITQIPCNFCPWPTAARYMGLYGGWSLKPQLGLGNAKLARNPGHATCLCPID